MRCVVLHQMPKCRGVEGLQLIRRTAAQEERDDAELGERDQAVGPKEAFANDEGLFRLGEGLRELGDARGWTTQASRDAPKALEPWPVPREQHVARPKAIGWH